MGRAMIAVGVVLLLAPLAGAQSLTEEEKKEGFRPLFNGKDFTGWRFTGGKKDADGPPKNWAVADGLIRLLGGGSPHLASEWDYDDFEVRLEWRAQKKGYNSGFFIRSGRQVGANQINLAQKAAGNLMGGAKGGPAVPELQRPPGEWNEWRVRAVGDKVTFWCNGKRAWEVVGFKTPRGYLGLQAEGAAIDFRNIRVQEIGYRPVEFGKVAGWDRADDTLLAAPDAAPLVSTAKHKDYTLRLEYRPGKAESAALMLHGKEGKIALADQATRKLLYPGEAWNYLEVAVSGDKAKVWLNGSVVPTAYLIGSAREGALQIVPGGEGFAVRRVRVRPQP